MNYLSDHFGVVSSSFPLFSLGNTEYIVLSFRYLGTSH